MSEVDAMKYANLHFHSTYSDGILTPTELASLAKALGFGALALADHDTVSGYRELATACDALGMEHMTGMEVTAKGTGSYHFVALDFDPTEKGMAEFLQKNNEWAYTLTKAKFDALDAAGEMHGVTWQNVLDMFSSEHWLCNEQVFAALKKYAGYTEADYWDWSERYGNIKVDVKRPWKSHTDEEMIKLIRGAGGVVGLAHPHKQTQYLPELFKLGLNGVECDGPDIDEYDKAEARRFAETHGMYILGGTDHSGRLAAYEERGDIALEPDGSRGDGSLTPYTDDVRTGISKEEFDMLKKRIYG